MIAARAEGYPLLIECTSNQVNQFGGYTGMTPADFVALATDAAESTAFPLSLLRLGTDHFGPNPWKELDPDTAMEHALKLTADAAAAGFTKIHLDASMPLGSERYGIDFDERTIAVRQAMLAETAERSYRARDYQASGPVYVIGSEVPIPGGEVDESSIEVTGSDALRTTISITREAFLERGLDRAWERVMAVVVQLGAEFGEFAIHPYDPEAAAGLRSALAEQADVSFEAHSTDYQSEQSLGAMVRDGAVILKVGPELTFAMREALFRLEHVERALAFGDERAVLSDLEAQLVRAMQADPAHWKEHYAGAAMPEHFSLRYSLFDRCRYYWTIDEVSGAVDRLMTNLSNSGLPSVLLSQFFPEEMTGSRYEHVIDPELSPRRLVLNHIGRVLSRYYRACLE